VTVCVAGISALGNTTKSTFSFTQDLVCYSLLRHWRSTEVHQRSAPPKNHYKHY